MSHAIEPIRTEPFENQLKCVDARDEKRSMSILRVEQSAALVIDGMASVQMMLTGDASYIGDLAARH